MIAAAAVAAATIAIVAQDHASLRNAPRDSAAQQAVLWQGDTLEVRAARMGYLQVWDPRRTRAGWVLASTVHTTALQPQEAPALLAVMRFLRDAPGSESLGIAYAAALPQGGAGRRHRRRTLRRLGHHGRAPGAARHSAARQRIGVGRTWMSQRPTACSSRATSTTGRCSCAMTATRSATCSRCPPPRRCRHAPPSC